MYETKALYDALKELQVISDTQLDDALATAQNQESPLGNVLLDKNLISEEDLGKLLADMNKVPFIHLSNLVIPKEILTMIPEVIARQQEIIAFKKDERGLHVALTDATNTEIISFLQNKLGVPIVVYQTTKQDVITALKLYLKDITLAFTDVIRES